MFRGTYGARTGLQTIVTALARQMIATGSSPAAIMRTFEGCVLNHPARLGRDPQSALTDDPNWTLLVELTRQCVADAAVETSDRLAPDRREPRYSAASTVSAGFLTLRRWAQPDRISGGRARSTSSCA